MNLKKIIFDRISRLPSFILFPIMKMNNFPKIIFGKEFDIRYKALIKKEITNESIDLKLIEIIKDAIENVPYYSKKYAEITINTIDDFKKKIEFIDKDIVVKNFDNFISKRINFNEYELQTTGGTSGKPLKIYQPNNRYSKELATVYYAWSTVGYNFDIRSVLRNHKIDKGKKFQINPITKEVQFNNFNINDSYLTEIYNIIKKYEIKFFHAYPSAAYQFVNHCKKNKLDLSFLKAFLCSSENILEIQRELIEKEFGIKLFGFYGHTEKLVFAFNCSKSDFYHIDKSYGFFELINQKGEIINKQGEVGEIVGSTLTNKGMPLIRYKTGDFAEYYGEICPHCGAKTTVLKNILGRWNGDKIFNKDGTFVTLTSLNLHNDIYTYIEGLQYYQSANGSLEIRLIKSDNYKKSHEKELLEQIRNKFNSDLDLTIKYVDKLVFHPNGKFLQLIK
jgi:phenylacetate-CoA ligase